MRRVWRRTGTALGVAAVGALLASGVGGAASGPASHPSALAIQPTALGSDAQSGHIFLAGVSLTPQRQASVLMLNGQTGQVLHTTVFTGTARPTWLAIDAATGRVFVTLIEGGASSYALATLETTTGALLRTAPVGLPVALGPKSPTVLQSVVLSRARVAVDAAAGRVVTLNPMSVNNQPHSSLSLLDARTGAVTRTVALSITDSPDALAIDSQTGNAFITTTTDKVLTYSPARGRIIQSTTVAPRPAALAVDGAAGRVLVASSGPPSAISILDTHNGQLLATIPLSTPLFLSPYGVAVDEATGRAFVLNRGTYNPATGEPTGQGSVLVLDTRAGRLLRTVTLGTDPGFVAVDAQRGRVFVLNGGTASNVNGVVHPHDDGSISVLDAATGAITRTIPAGGNPGLAAVEPRSGRLTVVGMRSAHGPRTQPMGGYMFVLDAGQ